MLDLAEMTARPDGVPADLDPARLTVVLDRVVVGPDSRRRHHRFPGDRARRGRGPRRRRSPRSAAIVTVSRDFHCPSCGMALARPRPLLFSFNHPLGACPECKGFGNVLRYDEARVVPDPTQSLAEGAVEPWSHPSGRWYQKQLLKAAKKRGVDVSRPYAELSAEDRQWVYDGGAGLTGIRGFFEEVESYRYKLHVRVFLSRYRSQSPCPRCEGRRLRPEALAVRVGGASIAELGDRTIEDLEALFATLPLSVWEAGVARDVLKMLRAKLSFLLRVGLGYLTLGRQTRTLSGGEAQRINLANQLGAQLTGTLYVLDEPSIGLHAAGHRAARRALPRARRGGQHGGDRRARSRPDRGGRLRDRDGPGLGRARREPWCSRAPRRSSARTRAR